MLDWIRRLFGVGGPDPVQTVLSILQEHGAMTGGVLRMQLADRGVHKSLPAFYLLMSQMNDAELIHARVRLQGMGGRIVKITKYSRVTLEER